MKKNSYEKQITLDEIKTIKHGSLNEALEKWCFDKEEFSTDEIEVLSQLLNREISKKFKKHVEK